MARLGQPYASTRARGRTSPETEKTGLGLGVFISATLIERTGGRVNYSASPLGGAQIEAIWPSGALQVAA